VSVLRGAFGRALKARLRRKRAKRPAAAVKGIFKKRAVLRHYAALSASAYMLKGQAQGLSGLAV